MIPVILFIYNRPQLLPRTLACLKNNKIDLLYVFSDGPKNAADIKKIEEARKIIDQIDWVKTVKVYREKNLGLAASITSGIGEVLKKHEAMICVEADICVADGFYEYMKTCLEKYKNDPRIAGVTGLRYPVAAEALKDYPFDVFFNQRFSSWGWGTWRRFWQTIDFDRKSLAEKIKKVGPDFDAALAGCGCDMKGMVRALLKGKLHECPAVYSNINMLLNKQFFIWPTYNMVENTGFTEGVHVNANPPFWRLRWGTKEFPRQQLRFPKTEAGRDKIMESFLEFFQAIEPVNSKWKRIITIAKNQLKKILRILEVRRKNAIILGYKKYLPKDTPPKTALLSYLTEPFLSFSASARVRHNSWNIARAIARVLNQSGFTVDIVNWQNENFIPAKKYDLFVGHGGKNFEKITEKLNQDCVKIYFATGLYWKFHNEQEAKRIKEVDEKKGWGFQPKRTITDQEEGALAGADAIIALGNEFSRQTYAAFPRVYTLDNFYRPDKKFNLAEKNFSATKNNFLFLSGPGNIHKGLDLALEAFQKTPDKNLYICAKLDANVAKAYRQELFATKNIHYIGPVKEFSTKLRKLMYRCGYFIHPSCSEGSPGSVLWAMSYGLVPAISRESCLNLGSIGHVFPENTVEALVEYIKSTEKLVYDYQKTKAVSDYAKNNFSENIFLEKFKEYLTIITNQQKI